MSSLKYIDAHTHPLKEYYPKNNDVILKAHNKGVKIMMITGCNKKENQEVLELTKNFDFTFPVIGIHPNESNGKIDGETIEDQWNESVKGIGEIGLDYYYEGYKKKVQIESFEAQIEVAKKHKIPVVVHMRDSYEDLYEIIKKYHKEVTFMIHTYSGDLDWAKKFYDLGCYFSFSGTVTYKNKKLIEVVQWLPLERILTETDAPYLAPAHKRGQTNYSNYVIHTANYLAGLKGLSIEKFTDRVYKNLKFLFKLDGK